MQIDLTKYSPKELGKIPKLIESMEVIKVLK